MEHQNVAQRRLFDRIEAAAQSQGELLVRVVAELLSLSTDSAYRRIRGETELSLHEASLLCTKYGISLDETLGVHQGTVTFFRDPQKHGAPDFGQTFADLVASLRMIDRAEEKEVLFCSMELPVFHLIQVPELLAFKLHYWTTIGMGASTAAPFDHAAVDLSEIEAIHQALILYLRVPTTEILFEDSLSSTLKQFLYYLDSGLLADEAHVLVLLDKLSELVDHIREQAARGFKFRYGAPPPDAAPGAYQLFYNEMVFAQNAVFVQADARVMTILEHGVLNYLTTFDHDFCAETRATLQTIMHKSTLISNVSERERNKFFNRLQRKISATRDRAQALLDT